MRRGLTLLLMTAVLATACGNTTPTGSGNAATPTPTPPPGSTATVTPEPTPTPLPTPAPTLPPLDATVFGGGWTLVTRDTNVGETQGVTILSSIGPTFTVAGVCTGDGTLTVQLFGVGGKIDGQVDLGQFTVPCSSAEPTITEFQVTAADYHGVRISTVTTAPPGAEYIVLVGSHG